MLGIKLIMIKGSIVATRLSKTSMSLIQKSTARSVSLLSKKSDPAEAVSSASLAKPT